MPPKPATIGVVYLTENIPSCDNKIKLAPLNFIKEKKLVYFPEFSHDADAKDLIQDFLLKLPQVIPPSWKAFKCKLLGTFGKCHY